MEKRKITVRDIAHEANVSIATVSRAINGTGAVKPETLQHILTTAGRLGYTIRNEKKNTTSTIETNIIPVLQTTQRRNIILVHIPVMSNPFYSQIIKGIESSMSNNNFKFLLYCEKITSFNIDKFIEFIKDLEISGLITLALTDIPLLQRICAHIPVVQCCEFTENPYASSVGINDYTATQYAIEYFLSKGKTRIGMINGPLTYNYASNRLKAFQSITQNAGIEIDPHWIIQLPDLNHDMAFSSVVQLLSSTNTPDCFFAVSDVLAAAAIQAAQYCNFRVPEDILIIGFDNTIISQLTTPSITTINQPKFQLGFLAGELLIEKMTNPLSEVKHMILNTELILRETTTTSY